MLWVCRVVMQPTCLTCGDVDYNLLFRGWAQIRHPVNRLYAEGVVGVGQQVCYQHFGNRETELSGYEMDTGATGGTCLAITRALPAVDAVDDIASPTAVSRRTPFQGHRGVVEDGDGVLGC